MEFRKMVTITLCTRQQKRHWCIEQSCGLCGRWRGWNDLGEQHWNMKNIICETSRQSRFDERYWMLGAGALGWLRGMARGGRGEEGSGWGTRVYLWQIHVDIWQNQYNIVKLKNKIKLKKILNVSSLWVVPVHQPQASSIMHRTWTGNSFHIWYYTCFSAILPSHPTVSLSFSFPLRYIFIIKCVCTFIFFHAFRNIKPWN